MSNQEKIKQFFKSFFVTHRERCGNTITATSNKANMVMLHFLEEDGRVYESVYDVPQAHRLLNGLVSAIQLAQMNQNAQFEIPEKMTADMILNHVFRTSEVVRLGRKELN